MSYVVVVLSVLFRRSNGGWWNVKGARKTRIARCIGQRWQSCRQFVVASFVPFFILFFILLTSKLCPERARQNDGAGWWDRLIRGRRRCHHSRTTSAPNSVPPRSAPPRRSWKCRMKCAGSYSVNYKHNWLQVNSWAFFRLTTQAWFRPSTLASIYEWLGWSK